MSLQALHANLECTGQQAIIGVQEYHVVTLASAQSSVARRREPLVGLTHIAHPRVAGDDLRSMIGRAVVDHHDLEVRVALDEYARDCLAQEVRLVITSDDYRN